MSQLPLPLELPHHPALTRSDFLVSDSNARALGWIDRWPAWPSPALVLYGPQGCGKTHLVHLWCERAAAIRIPGPALGAADLPEVLAPGCARIAVDDADRAAEHALLHLYNSCRERGGHLLLTASQPPAAWGIALDDLRSRLRAANAAEIGRPDDTLLAAVLIKHFSDRELRVAPELIVYLIARIERSLAAAAATVAVLDAAALAERAPINLALARKVLGPRADQPARRGSDSATT
jgi:chromosomal replication initiation ATPase DnaA